MIDNNTPQYYRVVSANEPPKVNDLYHTMIINEGDDESPFPSTNNYFIESGEWEVGNGYVVTEWLQPLSSLPSVYAENERLRKDGLTNGSHFDAGFTKREEIAKAAMQGYLSTENIGASGYPLEEVARISVMAADALLAELSKTKEVGNA